ncbi:MAG: hypothetical protein AAFR96_05585 [Planctomycetota bacterium]
MNNKLIISSFLFALALSANADDASARLLNHQGLVQVKDDNLAAAEASFEAALLEAESEALSITIGLNLAYTHDLQNDPQSRLLVLSNIVNAFPVSGLGYEEHLVDVYRMIASAYEESGNAATASLIRSAGVSSLDPYVSEYRIGQLYKDNAIMYASVGSSVDSLWWWDRLFTEQWIHGTHDESRAMNRLYAATHCGIASGTIVYRDRIRELLNNTELSTDRGNALLYEELYFELEISEDDPLEEDPADVAAEMYLLAVTHDWDALADLQGFPPPRSDVITDAVRQSLVSVLLAEIDSRGTTTATDSELCDYADYLLRDLHEVNEVFERRGELSQFRRSCLLQIGNPVNLGG